ncbi:MAG: response regulator [Desulfovibrio sp.]|uniref:response regulator n=1 Tax=Desulfovibrio sp. 7SRBS1 TaxID=3378064 RepID=UPI003B419F3E
MAKKSKILFVDDDLNILATFSRTFGLKYDVETAMDGNEGLATFDQKGPFSVVVSDLKMPGMSGIDFLARVREKQPDTVRIMLTGFAELETAIEAVNHGSVFRFLTKPCNMEVLGQAVDDALRQHRLVMAEKTLLRETLRGCVTVLSEILAMANPSALGRAERITRYIRKVGRQKIIPDFWKVELAGMLSQIGCMTIPEEILQQATLPPDKISPENAQILAMHPVVGGQLISNIPYLEDVSTMVEQQEYDLNNPPDNLPDGAKLIKLALDYDSLRVQGNDQYEALAKLKKQRYDPIILEAFEKAVGEDEGYVMRKIPLAKICPGMVLHQDLIAGENIRVMVKGQVLSETHIERIKNFARTYGFKGLLSMLVPLKGNTPITCDKKNKKVPNLE